jgi:hypothetical protein
VSLSEIEERVQRLEDMAALYQLAMSYGPAADSNAIEEAVDLWTAEGRYEVLPPDVWTGADELAELFKSERHQRHTLHGCAHVVSPPRIVLDGDAATGIGYQVLFTWDPEAERFHAHRVVAVHWQWQRTPTGWKIVSRTNKLLDGSQGARDLLRG